MTMANFNSQWIEIFKSGNYGPKGDWPVEKLQQVVANFNAGSWKPPAVLGHPEHDSPAMGWVEQLALDGGVLKAKFMKVQPQLEAHVAEGRYPNRSAAFYLDPQGKGPVLRHVGFLGGMPPEIKGLEPVKFSDGEFVAIEFKEDDVDPNEIKKSVRESVREFFAEFFGGKKLGETFSEADMNAKIAAMRQEMQSKMDETVKELKDKFAESTKKAEELSAAAKTVSAKEKVKAFIEGRRAAGQWVPAFDEAGLPAVLEHLAIAGGVVKFGEAGKEKEVETYDLLANFFEKALPQIVPVGTLKLKPAKGGKIMKFNEARGISLNEGSVLVAQRAEEISAERKISFGDALRVAREELGGGAAAAAGGTSSGAV
ncbi:MAG: hypothetical protein LAN84_15555 [Acidobacteriia bacterium]|nr:hypothetical protein [Terriglobia bacterium]